MTCEDIIEDIQLCQERWHKARREGRYFRAENWARMRDDLLDQLLVCYPDPHARPPIAVI